MTGHQEHDPDKVRPALGGTQFSQRIMFKEA
jgi:hypothetical protein